MIERDTVGNSRVFFLSVSKNYDAMQRLSEISQQNTSQNRKVSENIDKISNEVQTVNQNCEKMNKIAKRFEEAVLFFHN